MPRKVINPKTGRKINVGGATWNAMKKRSKRRSPKRSSPKKSLPRIPQYTMPPIPLGFF